MDTLCTEDNMNVDTAMEQDEMTCFGRIHEVVNSYVSGVNGPPITIDRVITAIEAFGGYGRLSFQSWREMAKLRISLDAAYADVLQLVQFNVAAGRVSVKPQDFGLVAKMDARLQWMKVVVLLYQYIGQTPKQVDGDMMIQCRNPCSGCRGCVPTSSPRLAFY